MLTVNYLQYDPLDLTTKIISKEILNFKGKPHELLEIWANTFGLGIQGSQSAFKHRLAIRQKIPVLIDPYRQIYFFPTQSPTVRECLWVNASQIKDIKSSGIHSIIRFKDGSCLKTGIGRRSLMKQAQRCLAMEQLIQQAHLIACLPFLTLAPEPNHVKG